MYTKHPPQKRNKTYRKKKLSLVAPIKTEAGEEMSSFERLGDRRTGKFLTLLYIRKRYFFS